MSLASGYAYRDLFPTRIQVGSRGPDLPVLNRSQMRGSWWPGIARRCTPCGGRLLAYGETAERDGELACLMCGRVSHEIRWDR